jgi:hypothetical protein
LPGARGADSVRSGRVAADEVTQFRSTWTDSLISNFKKQERLKRFFHLCVAREWIRTNPVAALKPIKVPPTPTLPVDEQEIAATLNGCDRYWIKASTAITIAPGFER